MTVAAAAAALERLLDLWTRASVEMDGCPLPEPACEVIGCHWQGAPCQFDAALHALALACADRR